MNNIFVAGLSYRTAPVAVREQFAVAPSDQVAVAERVRREAGLAEVVLLWTCNRVEIYGVAAGEPPPAAALMSRLIRGALRDESGFYQRVGGEAVRHLFSVASGMDSMVLGETEITGQVKQAYEKAAAAGLAGKQLHRLFQTALATAKKVRTHTAIGKGAASVGSVAVQHAQKIFGSSLAGLHVMVIGAGDMAEKCLRHLVKKGAAAITVVNRSLDKAELLAATFGGRAVPFGGCLQAMADVDIVITSTGCPHIILERGDIEAAMAGRQARPLALIDIAVPRDVAPEARGVPGVYLYDIGDLEATVRENIRFRERDLALCWSIIEEEATEVEPRLVAVPAGV